jgi:hypothetical protein
MASILDLVQQHLGPAEIAQISQQLGVDPNTTQHAVNAALPALVGAMANTAQQPQGASALQGLLGSHGGVLGSLGSLIGAGGVADGGGLLGQILGPHQSTVQQGVQQQTGLDSDRTRKLLAMLAPIVLGALARRAAEHGAAQQDPEQLKQVLQQDGAQAHQQAQSQSTQMGGLLGKLMSMAESPETRNR